LKDIVNVIVFKRVSCSLSFFLSTQIKHLFDYMKSISAYIQNIFFRLYVTNS